MLLKVINLFNVKLKFRINDELLVLINLHVLHI